MAVTHHGRDQIDYIRIGAKRDGTVTGIHAKIIQDCGSYHLIEGPVIPTFSACVIAGCYKFAAVQTDIVGVFTNKFTTDAIRGAGRPEATHMIELTMDALADELGMDRLELRRKNFITEFPYELPHGFIYDSGNYHGTLDQLPREARPRRVPARAGRAARARRLPRRRLLDVRRDLRPRAVARARAEGLGHAGRLLRVRAGARAPDRVGHRLHAARRRTARASRRASPRSSPTGSASTRRSST